VTVNMGTTVWSAAQFGRSSGDPGASAVGVAEEFAGVVGGVAGDDAELKVGGPLVDLQLRRLRFGVRPSGRTAFGSARRAATAFSPRGNP